MPAPRAVKFSTPAAIELITLFDELAHENREVPIKLRGYGGDQELHPLGAVHRFPGPFGFSRAKESLLKLDELPLCDIWLNAWSDRPAKARDDDGLEAVRMAVDVDLEPAAGEDAHRMAQRTDRRLVGPPIQVRYSAVVPTVLLWLIVHETPGGLADFIIDGFETVLATIPREKLTEKVAINPYIPSREYSFRQHINDFGGLRGPLRVIAANQGLWTADHVRRMFGLERWVDEPLFDRAPDSPVRPTKAKKSGAETGSPAVVSAPDEKIARSRPDLGNLLVAFDAGWANEHDVYDKMLGPPEPSNPGIGISTALGQITIKLYRNELSERVAPVYAPGDGTHPRDRAGTRRDGNGRNAAGDGHALCGGRGRLGAAYYRPSAGIRNCSGPMPGGAKGKSAVFSHLIRATIPAKGEKPEHFTRAVTDAAIDENALIAVAFYAPQWARFVEAALGWPGFEEAVWWFHAPHQRHQLVDQASRQGKLECRDSQADPPDAGRPHGRSRRRRLVLSHAQGAR